ncbi:MAG: hypothetical protein WHS44_07225 [Fimbriimonadales bacterium]|nr:MAG: hypothetical protein KatS3mg018_1317 [Fimbriimonadales bacterium]
MKIRHALTAITALACLSGAFAQCLITDFEGFALGANGSVLFRQPSFSGSTSAFLAFTTACDYANGVYNCAQISDEQAFSGTQSLRVAWQFRVNPNTGEPYPNAWLRLTTFNATNLPNPAINFDHTVRVRLYVPSGTPDFYLTLGIRETDTNAACGQNGGTTRPDGSGAGIEWIGATSAQGINAPIGKLVDQKDQWVTVEFNIRQEPVLPFAGGTANGQIDGTTGTIEHLAFTPTDPANLGPYIVYIDDIETVVEQSIPGDVNGDGCVDDADLLAVLFAFGQTGSGLPEDVNEDGVVDDADLLTVLFNFGQGC